MMDKAEKKRREKEQDDIHQTIFWSVVAAIYIFIPIFLFLASPIVGIIWESIWVFIFLVFWGTAWPDR
jgi:hypothetical protein